MVISETPRRDHSEADALHSAVLSMLVGGTYKIQKQFILIFNGQIGRLSGISRSVLAKISNNYCNEFVLVFLRLTCVSWSELPARLRICMIALSPSLL